MEIELTYKPKSPIVVQGFPGYGLVGTIVTEFLIKHLNAKQIGRIQIEEASPIVAVHDNKAVDPLGIFYDKKDNIIILHALTSVQGLEWQLAEKIIELTKQVKAKELLCIEGVGNPNLGNEEPRTFYMGPSKKLASIKNLNRLNEGIIMGVTGALLLKDGLPINAIFSETHSQMPDSRASAKIIEVLDKYLGLKVDYKPLLQQATQFEKQLRDIVNKSRDAAPRQKNTQAYFG
ncbi:MAG: PAC2 family protein [Nanoarchaeota archaeon]|nr:PAC2 family protein [Nanoarchaeota archaeon]